MKPIYLQEDNTSRRFLYLQLYDTIKARILQGEMVCGDSEKHAGFVINTGRATCDDVTDLMAEIQTRVFNAASVHLTPEVKIVEP